METSVNLTANLQNRPSFFEICASQLLDKTCYPALNRLIMYLGPRISNKLYSWSDEITLGTLAALQYFYLRRNGGSFGESFYGLSRESLRSGINPNARNLLSLSLLILPQYIRAKLTNNNEILTSGGKLQIFQKLYHYIELGNALFLIGYVMDLIGTHSLGFRILKLQLRYSEKVENNDRLIYSIFKFFEISAYFLQFIQWWNSTEHKQGLMSLKMPPALQEENSKSEPLMMDKHICPICLQNFQIPTVNSISGYVFCYRCITLHLQSENTCPVTNLPTTLNDLIRIYSD